MADYRLPILLVFLAFFSCRQKDQSSVTDDRHQIIEYLKTEFKISPDTNTFEPIYLKELRKQSQNLDSDSLISRFLLISHNNQFNIDLVQYWPEFDYKDSLNKEQFRINLIRNGNTQKIYFDFADWRAGIISGNYCAYSFVDLSKRTDIPRRQLDQYSKINTNRIFSKSETFPESLSRGMMNYLNDQFRFTKLQKNELDSLFNFYDEFHRPHLANGKILSSDKELVGYFSEQEKRIKSHYYLEGQLVYLKDQTNLLIIRNQNSDNKSYFHKILAAENVLFERMISISGDDNTFFEYRVDEQYYCF